MEKNKRQTQKAQLPKAERDTLMRAIIRQVGKLSRQYGCPNPLLLTYIRQRLSVKPGTARGGN
ncbi:MAG: hypothetical protein ABSB91_08980 [Sedimentisphaerales bacterium]